MATGMSQSERLVQQQGLVFTQMKNMLDAATREERGFTDSETERYAALEKQHADLERRIGQTKSDEELRNTLNAMTGGPWPPTGSTGFGARGQSAGALFANATASFFKAGHHHASAWRTEAIDVPYTALRATTLTEDPASGGKLVVPDYRPGVIPSATRPIVVMDLLAQAVTSSNTVVYMKETTFTNAAAPTAEGAVKPESALVFDQVSEPVLKIATWLPVTGELLEDVPAISAYIDSRLRLGVQLAEDDQLLNGNGVAPNYRGLLLRASAPLITQGASESVADAILRQIAQISTTAMVQPTGIILNPADWVPQMALKDTTNRYIGPSPFETPIVPTLWGLPVALTSAMPAKTALVGAFATMAAFFRRGDLRVEASNSHQDYFVKDLWAIRCEERGALATYRTGAFGKVALT